MSEKVIDKKSTCHRFVTNTFFLFYMVRNEGFEPPIGDSESPALPLGELRIKK